MDRRVIAVAILLLTNAVYSSVLVNTVQSKLTEYSTEGNVTGVEEENSPNLPEDVVFNLLFRLFKLYEHLRAENDQSLQKVQNLTVEVCSLNKQIETHIQNNAEQGRLFEKLKVENDKNIQLVNDLNAQLDSSNQQNDANVGNITEQLKVNEQLKGENDQNSQRVQNLTQQVNGLKEQNGIHVRNITEQGKLIEMLKAANDQFVRKVYNLTARVDSLNKENEVNERNITTQGTLNEKLKTENDQNIRKVNDLNAQLDNSNKKNEDNMRNLTGQAELIENLKKHLANTVVGLLEYTIKRGHIEKHEHEIYNEVFLLEEKLFFQAINQFLDKTSTEADQILLIINNLPYLDQLAYAHVALFDKKIKGNLYDPAMKRFAIYLAKLYKNSVTTQLMLEKKEYLKAQMPTSMSNLAFASKICLENVNNGKYLYADNSTYNNEMRNVFTSAGDQKSTERIWIAKVIYPSLDTHPFFYLKNVQRGEYLMASENKEAGTSIGGYQPQGTRWYIFPVPNGVKIQNGYHDNTYLCSRESLDSKIVEVISTGDNSTRCIWKIIEC